MAKDTLLLILVAGSALVFVGGCATVRGTAPVNIDQSSPQGLAVSFHEAVQSKNFAAMLQCMEPSKRGEFDSVLVARRRLAEKTERLAKLIEEKIGRKHAEMYLQKISDTAMFSPFFGPVEDGKVDWSEVKFKVEGNRASASIDGETSFHFKMIKGKWYMTRAPQEDTFSGWIMRQAVRSRLDAMAAAADHRARGITNGTINKDNFYEKMFGVDKDEGERLSRYAATPYGPAVDGVRIRLTTWAAAFGKGERIWFSMEIKYETDDWVCWWHPGTGPGYSTWLGENVVLELDGRPLPQPDVKADKLFKWGRGSTTLGTSIYFPVDFKLPPGRHTIRYTIISRGGTYTDPDDGRKYRIINGKLVSNTLTFFVSDRKMRPVPDESGATARSVARAVGWHIEGLSDENRDVRRFSALSLAEIGPRAKPALRPLIRALKDEESSVRSAVAEALGNIGPLAKEAVPALREALRDDNQEVRKAAAEALRKIQQEQPTTASTRPTKGS